MFDFGLVPRPAGHVGKGCRRVQFIACRPDVDAPPTAASCVFVHQCADGRGNIFPIFRAFGETCGAGASTGVHDKGMILMHK